MAPVDEPAAPPSVIAVEVLDSPGPRQIRQVSLMLNPGATVREALLASGLLGSAADEPVVGIWGRRVSVDTVLRAHDRVEIYRPLTVDPKEARRVRYRAQGEKLLKGRYRPKSTQDPK